MSEITAIAFKVVFRFSRVMRSLMKLWLMTMYVVFTDVPMPNSSIVSNNVRGALTMTVFALVPTVTIASLGS